MFECLKYLFNYMRVIREQREQIRDLQESVAALRSMVDTHVEQQASQHQAITTLSHALVYVATPPSVEEPEANVPVFLKKRSWLDKQRQFEFDHNRAYRDYLQRLDNQLPRTGD